jgi:hypothetical protein
VEFSMAPSPEDQFKNSFEVEQGRDWFSPMPDLSKEIHNILYIYKHQFRDGKNALYI